MNLQLRPALVSFLGLSLLTGLAYPLALTGLARLLFPHQAEGSLIRRDGQILGSTLIGQAFSDPGHFWGRPSTTVDGDGRPSPYDGTHSGGSNLAPSNPALLEAVKARITALRAADPDAKGPVPIDLVTASASGLDPDISPAAAAFQVPRVAKARGLDETRVRELVARHTAGPQLGILGEPRVNVVALNLDLDRLR